MQNRPNTSVQYQQKLGKFGGPQQYQQNDDNPNNAIYNVQGISGNQNGLNNTNQNFNNGLKTRSPQKPLPMNMNNGSQQNSYSSQITSNYNTFSTNNTQLPDIGSKKNPYSNFLKNKQPNMNNHQNVNVNKNNLTTENLQGLTNNQQAVVDFQEILLKEKDERYRYLLKHGTLKRLEFNGNIIFSELPQIPGIWVCYRRPVERDVCLEKLNLDQMDLQHIPLLEGEEKLKILTYQHNKIQKIENLVSLPALLYLDLYDNQIKDIENLITLPQLRVLLLPKNQISKIKNIDILTKLEVLDLHSNKIQKIEGIQKLPNLRILNLANNLLTKIEGLQSQENLVELNLKINQIEQLENIGHLKKLEKLFCSNNKISNRETIANLRNLERLSELNLDHNPIQKQRIEYYKSILNYSKNLQILDHKSIQQIKDELINDTDKQKQKLLQDSTLNEKNQNKISNTDQQLDQKKEKGNFEHNQSLKYNQSQKENKTSQQNEISNNINNNKNTNTGQNGSIENNNNNQNKQGNQEEEQEDEEEGEINPEEVITIIGQQWQKELERVKKLDILNAPKKEYMENQEVEGGHAEIEDDSILFIFGNAYEIVLENDNFQDQIQKIQFQYILFDFLIKMQTLNILKKFNQLKEIVLKDNYVSSLLQLAKLESINTLQVITIENSPLCQCSFLKEFIVYRFQDIKKINGKIITENDKQKAKQLFQQFDKILQLPEKFYQFERVRRYPVEDYSESSKQKKDNKNDFLKYKKDRHFMKLFTKTVNENAETFIKTLMPSIIDEQYQKQYINRQVDDYLSDLITNTLNEI